MKRIRNGRVFQFSLLKNFKFSFIKCYECAPVAFSIFALIEFLTPILSAFTPLLITKITREIQNGIESINYLLILIIIYISLSLVGFLAGIPERRFNQYTKAVKIIPHHNRLMEQKLSRIKYGIFFSKDFVDYNQMVRRAASNGCISSLSVGVFSIAGYLTGAAVVFVTLATLNIYCMLLVILPAFVQFLLYYKNASRDWALSKEYEKEARQTARYESVLSNYRAVRETKANKSSNYVLNKWEKSYKKCQKFSIKNVMLWIRVDIYSALVQMACQIATIVLCIFLISRGKMDVAAFAGILAAVYNVLSRTNIIAYKFGQISRDALSADSYRTFLESKDEECFNQNAKKEKFKSLEFRNVSFVYPDYVYGKLGTALIEKQQENPKQVLTDVSFKINKGERVAIVGENGSGKTTLTRLIAKLYEPTSGEILFNGKPLELANLEGYRENFSVINQEFANYQIPLADSVGAGTGKDLTSDQTTHLLKLAGAEDVFAQANEHQGLQTWLTREFNGMELSGGQKQKVSIARGFAKKVEVMMVDEPTSALDPIVEKKILDNILKATEGKTAIVISHRLSLCTKMDRIIYMENGRIMENGSHAELMKIKNGKYRALFSSQSKWYTENDLGKDKTDVK